MRFRTLHDWPTDYDSAVALQSRLRRRIVIRPLPPRISLIAGADVSYDRASGLVHAGVVVMQLPHFDMVETQTASRRVNFPYIPGLLSFREAPALLDAFSRLRCTPDAVIFDGQGIAHMRGVGLASHMGLWLALPSVGCAKSRLIGAHAAVGPARGRRASLRYGGRIVGSVLRTSDRVRPVYVSPGHLADIRSSVRLILRCAARFRLPEPIRSAHRLVTELTTR